MREGREEREGRERGDPKIFERSNRIFYRSERSMPFRDVTKSGYHYQPPRGRSPRGPRAPNTRRFIDHDSSRLRNRHIAREGNYLASRTATELNRPPVSREIPIKKSFRDLFSEKDIEEGGDWVQVRRKRLQKRERYQSPIIKRPCFRCGLGGHIRRNCPKKINMRCFGCSSSTHLVKDCTVIQRPEELKVELSNVYDITDKVQALSNFAIFRSRGPVNVRSLRAALIKGVWEPRWEGKIIPIDKNSYLVGFGSECHRDMAVLAGKIMFDGFAGTFYSWNEDRGAVKIFKPVIVWVTLDSLPLHFWGKEEITKIISSFGKVHKFDENLFKKKRADYVKVMVEVEDFSLIPKVVQCSYKAITDNKFRFYNENVIPSASCLPVSQWTEENYRMFGEEGGPRASEEEGWEYDGGAARQDDAEIRAGFMANAHGEGPMEGGLAPKSTEGVAAIREDAPRRADEAGRVGVIRRGERMHEPTGENAEEMERRRKGKSIMQVGDHQAFFISPEPDPISGSGSCDPINEGGALGGQVQEQHSDDAVSKAVPVVELGRDKDQPILLSEGSLQDEDMGGDGKTCLLREPAKGDLMRGASTREVEGDKKPAIDIGMASQEVKMASQEVKMAPVDDVRRQGSSGEKHQSMDKSGGAAVSVPPGFQRKQKSTPGASSPFGKLQRGGFKFLKRPATSSSSICKQAAAGPAKKNRPITEMPNKEIAEIASSVGVKKPLTEEQIGHLKALERDRASS